VDLNDSTDDEKNNIILCNQDDDSDANRANVSTGTYVWEVTRHDKLHEMKCSQELVDLKTEHTV
jgi:hypothetical protein